MRGRVGMSGWLAAMLLVAPAVLGQGADDTAVKTRVALAIARFAEVPTARGARPLQWCVAMRGTPPAAILDLARQKVGSKPVELHLDAPFDSCDVLYIHASFEDWRALLAQSRAPALTVGDVPGFLAAGGMVELVIDSDAVRFDVNLRALRGQGIRLPAQVLSLARQVKE